MQKDSLIKRYVFKLMTNIAVLIVGLVTQAIVPRGLGPKAYGDFNFLTNFFTQISNFLDMGTSIGFYTKLSQRNSEIRLVSFYMYFCGAASLAILALVATASCGSSQFILWPGQDLRYVYLAALWGILNWFSMVLSRMTDAYGITVPAELVRIAQKTFGLALIVLLYALNKLNLDIYFYYQLLLFVLLGAALIWIMARNGHPLTAGWSLTKRDATGYVKEFYEYSHPLFIYAGVGLLVGILDRWLLQIYAGSIQQGFFGFAFQISAVSFLFTGAMTPLLTREFSIAFGRNDKAEMAALFRRYIPLLYAVAAYLSCFLAVQAENVIHILGGNEYSDAVLSVAIMSFYPLHQTYGQLSGSVFFATGQTKQYRNIGIFFMAIGLPLTYVLIAPTDIMGLNAGAIGLAIKVVAVQILAVNIQLYYNSQTLRLPFWKYVAHQIGAVAGFLSAAVAASQSVKYFEAEVGGSLGEFILAGMVYTVLVAFMIYTFPIMLGLKKEDIPAVLGSIRRSFSSGHDEPGN